MRTLTETDAPPALDKQPSTPRNPIQDSLVIISNVAHFTADVASSLVSSTAVIPIGITAVAISNPQSLGYGTVGVIGFGALGIALLAIFEPGLLHLTQTQAAYVVAGGLAAFGISTAFMLRSAINPDKRLGSLADTNPDDINALGTGNKVRLTIGAISGLAGALMLTAGILTFIHPSLIHRLPDLMHLSERTFAIGASVLGATMMATAASIVFSTQSTETDTGRKVGR